MNIDTLITRFLLDPKGYKEGADKVVAETRRISESVGGFFSGLAGRIKAAFNPTAWLAGLSIVGASLFGLGTYAVNTAIGFDTIDRSLIAVTQSAERAKQVLAFDDRLAGPSIFTAEQLAQASLTLEAFKLQTEEFLPVAEKLGTVFGSNTEALTEFVDALGYIKNGRFGEGFESLTRAGLSRQDFEAKGLTFDKGGSFTGNADQALAAIEQLVNERFGKLSEAMASGPAAKLASVMDAIGRAARQAGNAILTILMPAANTLGGFIAYLVESGAIERAFNGIASLFSGKDLGDGLVNMVAWLVAALEHVPEIARAIGQAFATVFTWLRDNLIGIGRIWVAMWTFQAVVSGLNLIYRAVKTIQAAEEGLGIAAAITQAIMTDGAALLAIVTTAALAATAVAAIYDGLVSRATEFPSMTGLDDVSAAISRDQASLVNGFQADQAKGPAGAAASAVQMQTSPLSQIADNTKRTAIAAEKLSDIQDQVLGGGSVGKGAAAAVNLDKALGIGTLRGGGDKLDQAVRLMREHFAEIMGNQLVAAAYSDRGGR